MSRLVVVLAAAPLMLCACANTPSTITSGDSAGVTYEISVAPDNTTAPATWTLQCRPAGGDHPDPQSACATLAKVEDSFAPTAPDTACTEIYGGSGVARITGVRDGVRVDARYTRVNGCEIARWDALGPVLPGPIPGQPQAPATSAPTS